jgi:hypothetical protein
MSVLGRTFLEHVTFLPNGGMHGWIPFVNAWPHSITNDVWMYLLALIRMSK